jgi:hypothetical protein
MRSMHGNYDPKLFRYLRQGEIPLHFGEKILEDFVDKASSLLLRLLDHEARVQHLPKNSRFTKICEAHAT